MAVTQNSNQLKQALLAESSRQSALAKAHEDLQLQHSLKLQECQRLQADRDGLLANQNRFYDNIADNSRMQCSLTEAVEELASARLASAAAAKYMQECVLLKAQNELLTARLDSQQRGAAASENSMRQRHEQEVAGLHGRLSTATADHAEKLAAVQSRHEQKVAGGTIWLCCHACTCCLQHCCACAPCHVPPSLHA